jgi:DDB1- and CUL4-associated factor 6
MKSSIYTRILQRELGETSHYSNISGIYGSKDWAENLDIVNELGGHTGCVNALRYVPLLSFRPSMIAVST